MSGQMSVLQLSRSDSSPWGFRIQGGKEFGTHLSVLKVNPNSIAQKAGLQSGDAILKIGGQGTENMKHKEAQDALVGSGNKIDLVVQRGGFDVWKPNVTPVGKLPTTPMANGSVVTKTSLIAGQQKVSHVGAKHNVAAKPFDNTITAVMHKQFNSPAALYSYQNIAETLSAHTEVLASGVKGINFMKEDIPINKHSAVYRLVHEEAETSSSGKASPVSMSPTSPPVRHIEAPAPRPKPMGEGRRVDGGEQPVCGECGAFISGVFARIGDKSLHPECFKCNTCGVSLKNVGYCNVNGKLYCDFHAKAASRMSSVEAIKHSIGKPEVPISPIRLPHSAGLPSIHSVSPIPFHRMPSEMHHVESPLSPQHRQSPLSFTPAPPPNIGSGSNYPSSISRPAAKKPTSVGFNKQAYSQFAQITRAHSPATGGSKFTWPPQNQKDAVSSKPIFEPTVQGTSSFSSSQDFQHMDTSHSSSFTARSVSSVESTKTTSMFQSSSLQDNTGISSFSSAAPAPISEPLPPEPTPLPAFTQPPVAETITPAVAPMPEMKEVPAKPTQSGPSPGQRAQAPGIGSRPAPRRGRGQLIPAGGTRIPICAACASPIRGPFITALSKSWCPDHFLCTNSVCRQPLQDIGFVEDQGQLYCEHCYEAYLAPVCSKCNKRIKEECLIALDKHWHMDCFICAYCNKPFGNDSFFLEDGLPYCEKDWNELFTTKCVSCGFPIEAGDRWVEALNNNYHSQCFKCTICNKNLEGQSFYAKAGRPICKAHAR